MTSPSPQMPPAYAAARPQKLGWVTISLVVLIVLTALFVVLLPFLIPFLNLATGVIINDPNYDQLNPGLPREVVKSVFSFLAASVWIIEVLSIGFLVLYFLAFRAVQQGRSWGRIVAIIVFILSLFNFPFGTALGIFGLIGAFDTEVTAYCNR